MSIFSSLTKLTMTTQSLSPGFIYNDIKKAEGFWNKLKPDRGIGVSYEKKWKRLFPFFEQLSFQNSVLVLVCDLTTLRFIYAIDKRNVLGHEPSLYMADDGINFLMSNVHPDFLDSELLMTQKGIEYFKEYKEKKKNKIIVSFDGMYKKRNNNYMHYLQQCICLEANKFGQPLITLNYIQDITYLKKFKTANLVFNTPAEVKMWNYNFSYNMLEWVQPLSKQEKTVLCCLAKRESSKEIAKELFISASTIDTHRRNLLKKTNCNDTSSLITYSKLVGLL